MFSLGISYLYGNGTFADKVKAFYLFYQAANKGCISSLNNKIRLLKNYEF